MWHDLGSALALVLVLEGMLPFLRPHIWRRTLVRIVAQPDEALRILGLMSMLIGVGLLYFVR